jgi:hypothetical protein
MSYVEDGAVFIKGVAQTGSGRRRTLAFVKTPDGWRIALAHWSDSILSSVK